MADTQGQRMNPSGLLWRAASSLASRGLRAWEPSGDRKSERPGGHLEGTFAAESPGPPYGLPREQPECSSGRKEPEGRKIKSSPASSFRLLPTVSYMKAEFPPRPPRPCQTCPLQLGHAQCHALLLMALRPLGEFLSSSLGQGLCTYSPLCIFGSAASDFPIHILEFAHSTVLPLHSTYADLKCHSRVRVCLANT